MRFGGRWSFSLVYELRILGERLADSEQLAEPGQRGARQNLPQAIRIQQKLYCVNDFYGGALLSLELSGEHAMSSLHTHLNC